MEEKGLMTSKHLLSKLKTASAGQIRFITHYKIFKVDGNTNRHRDGWLASNSDSVRSVYRIKNVGITLAFGIMSSTSDANV